ncbi:hypothetical protein S83_031715, partial [Arachis hypogaea]
ATRRIVVARRLLVSDLAVAVDRSPLLIFLLTSILRLAFNKLRYTSKMLFAAIDENHHGTYDLMHLPIDFK